MESATSYADFLQTKLQVAPRIGLDYHGEPNPHLLPHAQIAAHWALNLGRALIAASFGMTKTRIQIEIARQIILHGERELQTNVQFLQICPLGVKHQFEQEDGPVMGVRYQYVRNDQEILDAETPYLITNYERVREGNINPHLHNIAGVSLDEGSVLRDMGSETFQVFSDVFADVPLRFVNTATPSPNRYIELLNYAEFLGVMDHGQALTRWFKRDTSKAGNLTLHPHHEKEFWMWVASWALFVFKPSDLGCSDEGYDLPELKVHWHRVAVDQSRAWEQTDNYGQHRLFLNAAHGVSEASQEKKATLPDRIAEMQKILERYPNEHVLLWHHLEAERHAIQKALPDAFQSGEAVSVYGSQDLEDREQAILDFTHGKIRILSTKPEIAGSGCNFQRHCHTAIFIGVRHQFEEFIQAVHRIFRFLQDKPVNIHIIFAESEDAVVENMQRKWQQHDALVETMREIVKKYGLNHEDLKMELKRKIGVQRREVKGDFFTAVNNDSTLELATLADNSVDLIHTSIPFGNHYEYTINVEDFGHNASDDDFWKQMDFLVPHLYRALKPGRIAAIHVKDRILYGHQTPHGFMEVAEFSDDCVKAFRRHGFLNMGRITIVTDVVRENSSTYRLGWSEMCKDGSKMGVGLPEYLLLFRKPPTSRDNARADEPVIKEKTKYSRGRWQLDAHSHWRSNGKGMLTPQELADLAPDMAARIFGAEQLHSGYDYERHVAICEEMDKVGHLSASYMMFPPKTTTDETDWVWDAGDIVFMRSLNSEQSRKREQNHICPLPFDIVDRVIRRFSNEDDLILEPFGGLGTVPYRAILMGRRAFSCELNPAYFDASVKYLQAAELQRKTPTLFDWLDLQKAERAADVERAVDAELDAIESQLPQEAMVAE